MPNPPSYVHGIKTKVFVGVNELYVEEVDWKDNVDLDDISNTGTGKYREKLDGLIDATASFSVIYDQANKQIVAPYSLRAGEKVVFHMKPDGVDDFTATFFVKSVGWKGGPKGGAFRGQVELESTGTITYPTS